MRLKNALYELGEDSLRRYRLRPTELSPPRMSITRLLLSPISSADFVLLCKPLTYVMTLIGRDNVKRRPV